MNNLYTVSGSLVDNKIQSDYDNDNNVPSGTPFFYGKQESLLFVPDNSVSINADQTNFQNFPSPYSKPALNNGIGPQISNLLIESITANKNAFDEDPVLRESTRENPFMNVMPLDYDSPQVFSDYVRYEGNNFNEQNKQVRNGVASSFNNGLIQNADSMFWNRLNSQREFVSQPVGSVPNNQGEFAMWLYGPNEGLVCKEGSINMRYGMESNDSSMTCNGFNVSVPTNKGLSKNFMSSVYGSST